MGDPNMSRKTARNLSRKKQLRPLAGLLAVGITAPAFADSVPFPTYVTGPQENGSYVVSDGTIINPARHSSRPWHSSPRQGDCSQP
jgi:hypothetical protein